MVQLSFFRATPGLSRINYESAFAFFFHMAGVNPGTSVYARQRNSLIYKPCRKRYLPGNWGSDTDVVCLC